MERLIYSKFSPKPSAHHLPQLGRIDAARLRLPAESLRVTSLFDQHDDPSRRSSLLTIPNRVADKYSTKCSSASSFPSVDLQNGSKPTRHLVKKIVERSFGPRKHMKSRYFAYLALSVVIIALKVGCIFHGRTTDGSSRK